MVLPVSLAGTYVDLPPNIKNIRPTPGVSGVQDYPGTLLDTEPATASQRYKWLPWDPGMISTTVLDCDVLTGPMTGCLLASYVDANGARQAVHIGTTEDLEQSDAVKTAWRGHATGITNAVVGFDPASMSGLERPEHIPGEEFPNLEIWGLITTTGRLFALRVYPQISNRNRYRIARVEEIHSLNNDAIRNWRGRTAHRSGFLRSLLCCFRS